jgi:4-hydroxybenzoate polyprenyltransferase
VKKFTGFLRLMRPANIVTAIADILAGLAISGYLSYGITEVPSILLLILATIGLYGGGVVLNDYFDAELDRVERPERPIPSGLIAETEALLLGLFLLTTGVACAFCVSILSGCLALATATAAVVYDKWGKHHATLGPLNMGLCRGLNLLLGISINPLQVSEVWYLALIPVIYIAAITMVSRGEVHGGKKNILYSAASLYVVAMVSILYVSFMQHTAATTVTFVLAWGLMVFIPLKNAIAQPQGKMIGKAVKAGVIALILMNAAWSAAFGATALALIIALLLPVSVLLAKIFAVT